jgi:Ser/Thr protein kinase RdoA (MazF antagonist)
MSTDLGETSGPWDLAELAAYDLTPPLSLAPLDAPGGINNQVRVVTTGAGRFLWKGYLTHADPARIGAEHRLLGWLAGAGLPFATPAPLPSAGGDTLLAAPGGRGWRALFPWLPGGSLDRRNPATIAALGAALGTLHGALARLPADLVPPLAPNGALAQIHPLLPDPYRLTPTALGLPEVAPYVEQCAAWRAVVAEVGAFIQGPYATLPRQTIHGDFGPGNAMADGDRITAIYDFEFALYDARAIDLAAGLGLTIRIWQLDPPESLALAAALCRGYARTVGLTATEVGALPDLLILREVVGAIWWLGRALATGDARPRLNRLDELHALIAWLREHRAAFAEATSEALG